MATKAMEIFRAGTHKTSAGEVLTFGEMELRISADAYNKRPAGFDAPVVMGHPRDERQAIRGGVVLGLVAEKRSLYAVADITSEFVELVRTGRILDRSAAFLTPDSPGNPQPGSYFLRHVGMLGAEPPAVKGMERLEFSEAAGLWQGATATAPDGFAGALAALQTIPGLQFMQCVGRAHEFTSARKR